MSSNNKIGVVIVTYNRIDKLKTALDLFDKQEILPGYILVVDNASTDGTVEFLKEWQQQPKVYKKYVSYESVNSGGSGGFHSGLEQALKLDCDWIWVSDDDAFPDKEALKVAAEYINKHDTETDKISAICGAVINNGRTDHEHRRNIIKKGLNIINENIPESEYSKEYFELNCFSYVGTIISKAKMMEVGTTRKDYFIWWDDSEHSIRLSKVGKIICLPKIKIYHDTPCQSAEVNWKTYYGYRNSADLYKTHFQKKYFMYYYIKTIVKSIIKIIIRKNPESAKMQLTAISDCRKNRFGLHSLYKPGWKISK